MSFSGLLTRRWVAGVVVVAIGFAVSSGRAADDGVRRNRPIEISAPSGSNIISGVSQLGGGNSLSQLLQDSLSVSPQLKYTPKTYGNNRLPPPAPDVIIVRPHRNSDGLDLGPGWNFGDSQDPMEALMTKTLLAPSGAPYKQPQNPFSTESVYRKVYGSGTSAKANPWVGRDPFDLSRQGAGEDKNGVNSADDTLSLLSGRQNSLGATGLRPGADFGSPLFQSAERPTSLGDVFGLSANRTAADIEAQRLEKRAHEKALARDYEHLLDGVSGMHGAGIGSLHMDSPWKSLESATRAASSKSKLLPNPLLTPVAALPVNSIVDPSIVQPKAPVAPVPSSLAPVLYTPPPLHTMPPPKPAFAIPRRAF